VSGFARGLAVIEAFDQVRGRLSPAEVAEPVSVDRAVARRMLLMLIELGLVAETQRHYQLTVRVLRLGYSFLSQTGFDGIAHPFVAEVAKS
jgi:IclR family pca regulon transcriptional regulator